MDIVIIGLSITSSWGNGHATTYRALVRALAARGHRVHFIERNVEWYASNRDLPDPPYCRVSLYESLDELRDSHRESVAAADLVIVGSFVPDGVAVGDWVQAIASGLTAFYDIDTPVTLSKLGRGDHEYLEPRQIPGYDLYLSFTGGPTLDRLERDFGSPAARALYCSFDPETYFPEPETRTKYDLGYLGTYSDDRQPGVDLALLAPARAWPEGCFIVAGPGFPDEIDWPTNVERVQHLAPNHHRRFYNQQRFTLNVTRADMVAAGFAPSVRLFEAAACGTPIISDYWRGLDTLFKPGEEILIAKNPDQVLDILRTMPDDERRAIGEGARQRVMHRHTADHRAVELETYLEEARDVKARLAPW